MKAPQGPAAHVGPWIPLDSTNPRYKRTQTPTFLSTTNSTIANPGLHVGVPRPGYPSPKRGFHDAHS